ncbi:MAG: long-chain fatty acid--CoA ligase [Myxococcota bacterium]
MAATTLGQMVHDRATQSPDLTAFKVKDDAGTYRSVNWKDVLPRMEAIGAGLLTALDEPLADDAHVTIIGNTSMDWVICDFAALAVGLRTVPIYATLLPKEVGYMHADTKAVIAIAENAEQLEKVRDMRTGFTFFDKEYGPELVKLKHVVVIDPTGIAPADDWESLADLEARGNDKLDELRSEMERRRTSTTRDQIATYTYTSGTTGPQKAVIQSNDNMLSTLEMTGEIDLFPETLADAGLFLFLPLAHSFGRLIETAGPYFGFPLVISSVPTLVDDLGASKPGFFPSAPRVYEKMKSRIEGAVAGASPLRKRLFDWAINTGKATVPYRSKGKSIPFFLGLQLSIADRLVLSRLRERLGFTRTELLLSGSAPLSPEVHEFFLAMNLDLVEGYGLTETCPALTVNRPDDFKLGTVGKQLPGIEVKIAEDGEIIAKGSNITQGYLNRPEATSDAFDEDGWFHTGDLGSKDAEGFVKITGRKKELIKTSGGKYVAPAKIEGQLKDFQIIQEAVVIGDRRNYCVALISLDPEELEVWAPLNDASANVKDDKVKAAVQAHVDKVNEGLASFETIKYFRLLDEPMTVENGILTASLKVKRKVVEDRFADLIENMYKSKKTA